MRSGKARLSVYLIRYHDLYLHYWCQTSNVPLFASVFYYNQRASKPEAPRETVGSTQNYVWAHESTLIAALKYYKDKIRTTRRILKLRTRPYQSRLVDSSGARIFLRTLYCTPCAMEQMTAATCRLDTSSNTPVNTKSQCTSEHKQAVKVWYWATNDKITKAQQLTQSLQVIVKQKFELRQIHTLLSYTGC